MKHIAYILILLAISLSSFAANENAKIAIVGDSRISEVFGAGADPRNGIGHRLTEICPIQVMVFASGGQRMSRHPWPASTVTSLAFVDSKDGLIYAEGFYDGIKAIVIMLDYNDWVYGDANSLNKFIRSYREVINYYQDTNNNPVVIVSGIITIDEESLINDGGFTLQDFRDAQEALAIEFGIPFIDGKTLIPQNQMYFTDSHHPNNLGSYTMAANLAIALQAINVLPANY